MKKGKTFLRTFFFFLIFKKQYQTFIKKISPNWLEEHHKSVEKHPPSTLNNH